ncbi:MAG: hypothetical protein EXR77_15920 [Myxococcales bacterium]|nr:hypothetical protein [Myxococcales bacterium]
MKWPLDQPVAVVAARAAAWLLAVALTLTAVGCTNPEFEHVRSYKEFLNRAKPPLQAMNKVRQELYEADDIDAMLVKFDTGLLVNIEELRHLADSEKMPGGKLGELHDRLRKVMDDYVNATQSLVKRLKLAKKTNNDDEIQRAILDWGTKDKEFGDHMFKLVTDLNYYLDRLVKG